MGVLVKLKGKEKLNTSFIASGPKRLRMHLLPVELAEAFSQLDERGLHTGVVGQS